MTDQVPGSGSPAEPPGDGRPVGPNPFSREGSAGGAHEPDPAAGPPSTSGPAEAPDPYGYRPGPGPADAAPVDQPPAHPISGPTSGPPWAGGADQPYGQNTYPGAQPSPDPSQPYAQPGAPAYPQPPAYGVEGQPPAGTYGASGYAAAPYAGGYGGSYPDYGAPAIPHPQATAALVTGIIAAVFAGLCGVGGLVGIASIVLGAKARREIDGDPARYTGRGQATAGLVLGITSVVLMVVWVLVIVGLRSAAS